jgi:hypothetical protein
MRSVPMQSISLGVANMAWVNKIGFQAEREVGLPLSLHRRTSGAEMQLSAQVPGFDAGDPGCSRRAPAGLRYFRVSTPGGMKPVTPAAKGKGINGDWVERPFRANRRQSVHPYKPGSCRSICRAADKHLCTNGVGRWLAIRSQ